MTAPLRMAAASPVHGDRIRAVPAPGAVRRGGRAWQEGVAGDGAAPGPFDQAPRASGVSPPPRVGSRTCVPSPGAHGSARRGACEMADDFVPGLEGVIAFETEIAEPDKDGGALRYRGVDIEDLVGKVTFGNVWALLVDGKFGRALPPAEPFPIPVHSGDVRVDVQAALAMLAPIWDYKPLLDITDEDAREQLARASVMALSYVAQSAR